MTIMKALDTLLADITLGGIRMNTPLPLIIIANQAMIELIILSIKAAITSLLIVLEANIIVEAEKETILKIITKEKDSELHSLKESE